MDARISFSAGRGSLLGWRLVLLIVLCGMMLTPLPDGLFAQTVWPAPSLLHPPDGATTTVVNYPPAAVPYFEWEAVAGATQYQIQIDNEIAFGDPLLYSVMTPNTRYIPIDNSKLKDGTIYWRVRVYNSSTSVGEWSSIRQFTKDWSTTDNAVELLSPADGAVIEFFEAPTFSWSPVIGAAEYVLNIDNDSDCNTPSVQRTTAATAYNFDTRLANGTYYWCVTPRDPAGNNGRLSQVRQIIVSYARSPQLLSPANYAMPVYTPEFRWTAVKGASAYKLQYSTDENFTNNVSTITTKQTAYTPDVSIPNDVTYYWRVAVSYGSNYEGPYSEVWRFTKKWYQQPRLLTPRPNELVNPPLFTWTPVREAKFYRLEITIENPGFTKIHRTYDTANTFYYWGDNWSGEEWNNTLYWRVTPYDQSGFKGQASEVGSFRPRFDTGVPENIWPRYFYTPPFIASGDYAAPYNIPISYDYTVDTPTFYWSRTMVPASNPRREAVSYRLQVDDDPNFITPEWTVFTENLSATPTEGNPFTPTAHTNYYWRVTPYGPGGSVLTDSLSSQPWLTQIDLARRMPPVAGSSPMLQFPLDGEKAFEITPAFEWLPQQGASHYEFAISTDPDFSSTLYVTRTAYTQHTPIVRLPLGTYFWRVCGLDSYNNQVGTWSDARRVIIAMQSRWFGVNNYTLGVLPAQYDTLLARDGVEGLGATELTTLHVAQDSSNWFIGFHVTPVPGSMVWYGLYLDTDQTAGAGAPSAPPGRPTLTTSSYFRPEYAIYVIYENSNFVTTTVPLHTWQAAISSWDPQVKNLVDVGQVGGALHYNPGAGYIELKVPKGSIGDRGDKPFALSVALFSASSSAATVAADTVPDNGMATGVLTEFKTIGDQVSLVVPRGGLPSEYPTLPYSPYLYAASPKTDLFGGYKVEVSRDPLFTTVFQILETRCNGCEPYPDLFQYIFSSQSIYDDNTLYWRFAVRHKFDGKYYDGPPSEPHVFTKAGPTPANLRVRGNYSTPTFVWDAVEGAGNYQFELASNPDFSPNLVSQDVNHESFTPRESYAAGTYYWRVRAENSLTPAYGSNWSSVQAFTITLPQTSLVEPIMEAVVQRVPTFKWNAFLVAGDANTMGWSAPKYRLQVANNPNFSSPLENLVLDTITWTPLKGYADGEYYWRVAVVDANNREGPFSAAYRFTKQYPVVELVAPLSGSAANMAFPTFIWRPVDGAVKYAIQIAENRQFSPLIDSATTNNTIFTPGKKYTAKSYYWRVAIIDKNGNYGPWTDSVLIDPYSSRIFLPLTLRNYKK